MIISDELNKIKNVYGENFMYMCMELFPRLLIKREGRLFELLTTNFSENCKDLYETISSEHLEEEFENFIYSMDATQIGIESTMNDIEDFLLPRLCSCKRWKILSI